MAATWACNDDDGEMTSRQAQPGFLLSSRSARRRAAAIIMADRKAMSGLGAPSTCRVGEMPALTVDSLIIICSMSMPVSFLSHARGENQTVDVTRVCILPCICISCSALHASFHSSRYLSGEKWCSICSIRCNVIRSIISSLSSSARPSVKNNLGLITRC